MSASLPPLLVDIPRNPFLAVGIPVTLGVATGLVTRTSSKSPESLWYKSLARPKWEPPRWAFGVVWPLLYIAMGVSSHLTVKALDRTPPGLGRTRAMNALKLYYAQLALNQLWTPLFFGAGQITISFANLSALLGTIAVWGWTLKDVDERAAILTVPYLAWSAYATALNGFIWWKNSGKPFFGALRDRANEKKKGN
ncbi:TspO/MBR-related protein [Meira miltonrushii]|uniref:TspO/MBR-related protein n=1 Tax=Meira miltonrushii TaxID=1280837 RepID=A0A316VK56_9BASI|nr:TspO/MBR-related protein [Meira miltonrushii]PWN37438.1 TspO/MBR-related protein [Meira miltonrushii]